MNILDIFRRKTMNQSESTESRIEFESYGEGIIYSLPDKSMNFSIGWVKEPTLYTPRLYTEMINKWEDGTILNNAEKKRVFSEVVRFIGKKNEKPIIVISLADSSRGFWEKLCSEDLSLITGVEYTFIGKHRHFNQKLCLDLIAAGKRMIISGNEIRNEKELDEYLQRC
jgi:hypothetical protein